MTTSRPGLLMDATDKAIITFLEAEGEAFCRQVAAAVGVEFRDAFNRLNWLSVEGHVHSEMLGWRPGPKPERKL